MRLSRVDITNFRSIADASIHFDRWRCRVLVGINESGKSNILEALALLAPDREPVAGDIRVFPDKEAQDQDSSVSFVFNLTPGEVDRVYEKLVARVLTKSKLSSTPVLTFGDRSLSLKGVCDEISSVIYEVNVRLKKKTGRYWLLRRGYVVAPGWQRPKENCPDTVQVRASGQSRNLNKFALVRAEEYPEFSEYLDDVEAEYVNRLVAHEAVVLLLENLPTCIYWSYNDQNLLPPHVELQAFVSNPEVCRPLKEMFALAGIDEIPRAVTQAQQTATGLRNLLNRVATTATKHVRSVWRDFRGVRIELLPDGPRIAAHIKDLYNTYDMSSRSDGFKRFVTFLLLVSAKAKTRQLSNTLYLQDEPDAGLHPSGTRYLRDELIRIGEDNYVVYSTHSIFMIDREAVPRHLIVEKKREKTTIQEAGPSNIMDEEVLYNALGYSVFESLRAENIIFEGWRDKRLFQIALNKEGAITKAVRATLEGAGLCHARGAKDVRYITPLLELANRKCVIISDSDKVARECQRDYDGHGEWCRYDQLGVCPSPIVTGEDYLESSFLAGTLTKFAASLPGLPAIGKAEFERGEPAISVVRRWLVAAGYAGEELKEAMDGAKGMLFNDLTPNHIRDAYFEFLKSLAAKVDSL